MKCPETSRLFSRWRHPASGVESWVLTERLAPVQRGFYFTNSSWTEDGRFLWVECAYPPPGSRIACPLLAVVDFEHDEIYVFHETSFPTAQPAVNLITGEAYWGKGAEIWKRGPRPEDVAVRVNLLPPELIPKNRLERLATHLTFSADGQSVNVDARVDRETILGDLPLNGQPFRLWHRTPHYFNHAQFSPTDSDLQLLAYEYWKDHRFDPFDGTRRYHRLWLLRRGRKPEPILSEPQTHSGHEWWDLDGSHVWYVHYSVGVKRVDLRTRQEEVIWPGHLSHAHADRTGRYLVADRMADPHDPDCYVVFFNRGTGKEVEVVRRSPLPRHVTQAPHLHPHPRFCRRDRYIVYTTTVWDRVDLAVVRTADLVAATA